MNIVNYILSELNIIDNKKLTELVSNGKYDEIIMRTLEKLSPLNRRRVFLAIPTLSEELNIDHSPSKFNYRTKLKYKHITKDEYKNVVFWDYAEIYNLEKENNKPEGIFKNVLVSTNGDVITIDELNNIYIQHGFNNTGDGKYKRIRINTHKYMLHRVIGCTFVPIPKDKDIRTCVTNHLNNNHGDNHYLNFEWSTNKENNLHGIEIGARKTGEVYYQQKPLLLEVISDNEFKGRKYVLKGLNDCEKCGFQMDGLLQVVDGFKKSYYGHSVKLISLEEVNEYEIGMPDDIKSLYLRDKNYFTTDIKPVIGEILEGPYKGFQFSFFGSTEVNNWFQMRNVFKVLQGERLSHKNCKWRHGTISESIPIHNKLTNEIYQTL